MGKLAQVLILAVIFSRWEWLRRKSVATRAVMITIIIIATLLELLYLLRQYYRMYTLHWEQGFSFILSILHTDEICSFM